MAKIVVTGSTGFIGKRLIFQLLSEGHEVFALVRVKGIELKIPHTTKFHAIYGDLKSLSSFPHDIDAAYYLVHSMGGVVQNLKEEEEKTARNFIAVLEKTKCKQIIFLSGIIENERDLSPHLQSRLLVERILMQSQIPCTILRSSIIIGSGSASFEIIRDLVEKLPVMVAPRWIKTLCQPIAIRDVLYYLTHVLLKKECFGKNFDIGGPEAISFKNVLLRYATYRGLRRYILNVPVLTPKLSSYWLVLVTSVRFSICQYLVESMRCNTRKLNCEIDRVLPHPCISYEEALKFAFQKIDQNEVVSTWMDAWDPETRGADVQEFLDVPHEGCLYDLKVIPLKIPVGEVQKRLWSIGGNTGWYSMGWAWRLRGLIDQLFGGTGFNRGRRHPTKIEVGDSIDFWRVLLADEKRGHLILYAEMKLPGEAWLEFEIKDGVLKQKAIFRPRGVWGRIYWYMLFPFHLIIFKNMAKGIAQRR